VTSPLDDRRQRAREAYYDRYSLGDHIGGSARKEAVRECVETATRVQITHEVILAFIEAPDPPESDPDDIAGPLRAAFRAAGFEVEE